MSSFSNYSQQEWPTIDENWIDMQEKFYNSKNYYMPEFDTREHTHRSEYTVSHNQRLREKPPFKKNIQHSKKP